MPKRVRPFQVILIGGKKRSGKDTAASRLITDHGFIRTSFAGFLKSLCHNILTNMECQVSHEHFEREDLKESLVTDIDGNPFEFETYKSIDVEEPVRHKYHTWSKGHMTYRQILQIVGTEMFRNNIHRHIWAMPVKRVIREAMNDLSMSLNGLVISDFRFPNEYEEIEKYCRRFGARVEVTSVAIKRPGLNKNDNHSSETSLDDFVFDIVINNDGSIGDLFIKMDKLATGAWRMDIRNAEITKRKDTFFLNKYDKH